MQGEETAAAAADVIFPLLWFSGFILLFLSVSDSRPDKITRRQSWRRWLAEKDENRDVNHDDNLSRGQFDGRNHSPNIYNRYRPCSLQHLEQSKWHHHSVGLRYLAGTA